MSKVKLKISFVKGERSLDVVEELVNEAVNKATASIGQVYDLKIS